MGKLKKIRSDAARLGGWGHFRGGFTACPMRSCVWNLSFQLGLFSGHLLSTYCVLDTEVWRMLRGAKKLTPGGRRPGLCFFVPPPPPVLELSRSQGLHKFKDLPP